MTRQHLIKEKAIRRLMTDSGLQVSGEAMDYMDEHLRRVLDEASVVATPHYKRLHLTHVIMAVKRLGKR